MIPKIIHYCWFGRNPKSKLIEKCIDSWEKFCPDWQIIEWNEDNYDVTQNEFCRQAYANKKWAFVSDYARFDILYRMGGIYMDTDVEVIQSLEPFLKHDVFAGHETDEWVAPGLILGSVPKHPIMRQVLEAYQNASFMNDDGSENHKTVGEFFTAALKETGIELNGAYQEKNGVAIYPKEYFCPLDDSTGVMSKTSNTYTIHWYSKTWISPAIKWRTKITRPLHRIFGVDCFEKIKRIIK